MSKQSQGHALHELPATELVEGYRRGDFSPVEVTRSVLGHIERWERHLQALFLLRPDQALEQARASEDRWRRGAPLGPIDGVPLTLKDNIATEGDPDTAGHRGRRARPGGGRCPAGGPRARKRRRAAGQDHHARLRHAVLGPVQLPCAGAQSLGPQQDPGRLQLPAPAPRRRPATGRCTWAPTSAARCACRPAGAASSRSSPAWAASRSIRPTPAARPGR